MTLYSRLNHQSDQDLPRSYKPQVLDARRSFLRRKWAELFMISSCAVLFISGVFLLHEARQLLDLTDQRCASQTSVWSPLSEAVEFEEHDYLNYFSHKTQYRGPPTKEREAAWDRLFNYPSISIPDSKLHLMNRQPDPDVYLRTTAKELAPGYLGGIEVFHHLHCLNLIRQFTWLDHYEVLPVGLTKNPVMNRLHVDHCIETVRLALQCNADVTPYLVLRADNTTVGAKADFNAFHKCKKFEPLVNWMARNGAVQQTPHEVDPHH